MTRRSLLLAAPASLLAAKPTVVRAGAQTNAWPIDPKDFDSLLSVLATVKDLGFEGFETGFINVRGQFARPEVANARLRKTGLRFFGVHIFLKAYDPQTAIAPWTLLQQVADGGAALGAERLILSGAPTAHPLALRAKVDGLNRIAKYCKGIGIGCAYHNHDVEFRYGATQMNGLLSGTDSNLHFVLDAGHAIEGGANVAEFFTNHWRRLDGIHLRDARSGTEVPLGEGEYDWTPLAKAIQASPWRGWLLAEEERLSGAKPREAAMRPARATIRRIFGV